MGKEDKTNGKTHWPAGLDLSALPAGVPPPEIAPGTCVMICTPAYDGKVCLEYFESAMRTRAEFEARGIGLLFHCKAGDGLVQRARAALLSTFVETVEATHLLFVDSDIGWKPESVIRMLLSGRDVIAAVYRKRQEAVEFPLRLLGDKLTGIPVSRDGCMEIQYAPTGFLMVTRAAVVRMIARYPERRCMVAGGDWTEGANRYAYDLFPTPVDDDGMLLSEDYGFCKLWRAIGGKVWFAPEIGLKHCGSKVYEGNFAEHFKLRPVGGQPEPGQKVAA